MDYLGDRLLPSYDRVMEKHVKTHQRLLVRLFTMKEGNTYLDITDQQAFEQHEKDFRARVNPKVIRRAFYRADGWGEGVKARRYNNDFLCLEQSTDPLYNPLEGETIYGFVAGEIRVMAEWNPSLLRDMQDEVTESVEKMPFVYPMREVTDGASTWWEEIS